MHESVSGPGPSWDTRILTVCCRRGDSPGRQQTVKISLQPEKLVEEVSVPADGRPQLLGFVPVVRPPVVEVVLLRVHGNRQYLGRLGDERTSLGCRAGRIVDEPELYLTPAGPETVDRVVAEQPRAAL